MKLSIYKRTDDGEISYHGAQSFTSPVEFFKKVFVKTALPPEEMTVIDPKWPDRCVTWRGQWGYAGGPAKLKLRQINLTDEQVELAKSIGDGNISEGVRLALALFE